jgi:hypothetical protein
MVEIVSSDINRSQVIVVSRRSLDSKPYFPETMGVSSEWVSSPPDPAFVIVLPELTLTTAVQYLTVVVS